MDDLLIEGLSVRSVAGSSMSTAGLRPQTAPSIDQYSQLIIARNESPRTNTPTKYKTEDSTHSLKVAVMDISQQRPLSQHLKVKTQIPKPRRSSAPRQAVQQSFRGTLELDSSSGPSRLRNLSPAVIAVMTEAKSVNKSTVKPPAVPLEVETPSTGTQDTPRRHQKSPICDDDCDILSREDDVFGSDDDEDCLDLDRMDSGLGDLNSLSHYDNTDDGAMHVLLPDEDNAAYRTRRHAAMRGLSDKDTAALRLGRLVMSTVLNQPEVTSADSLSRFFTDMWLSRSGGDFEASDSMSMTLMSNIQRAVAEFDPGVDAGPLKAANGQKAVAAVACEALDALIAVFGKANPVLTDIREALMPLLFMSDVPPPPCPLSNDEAKDMFPLTGRTYSSLPTYCEDTALVLEDLRAAERVIDEERAEIRRLESAHAELKEKYRQSVDRADESYGKLRAAEREQDRLRGLYKALKESHQTLKEKHDELDAAYSAEKGQHDKLKRDHAALLVKQEKTQEKYYQATAEKRRVEEEKAALKVDLTYYKTENVSLHGVVTEQKATISSLTSMNGKLSQQVQDLEALRSEQTRHRQETLQRIQKAVSTAETVFVMSSKMHALLRDPFVDIVELLECWNIDLIKRNSELELLGSETTIQEQVTEKTQQLVVSHQEELQRVKSAMQAMIDSERRDHSIGVHSLQTALDAAHEDLLATQIELNVVEKNMKRVQSKFNSAFQELEMRRSTSQTLKVTLMDQLNMMAEDNMFEQTTRDLQKWKENHCNTTSKLQSEVDELTVRCKSGCNHVAIWDLHNTNIS